MSQQCPGFLLHVPDEHFRYRCQCGGKWFRPHLDIIAELEALLRQKDEALAAQLERVRLHIEEVVIARRERDNRHTEQLRVEAQLAQRTEALRTLQNEVTRRIDDVRTGYGHGIVERLPAYNYDMEIEAALGELEVIRESLRVRLAAALAEETT